MIRRITTECPRHDMLKTLLPPLLVVHGEEDRRVPITQGEQYYRFLKKMGKTTEFLRFPREGHGVDEPRHRLHLDREEEA